MMRTSDLLLAAMAFAAPGWACAESSTVSFTLDPSSMLALPGDTTTPAVGHWLDNNDFHVSLGTTSTHNTSSTDDFGTSGSSSPGAAGLPFGTGAGSVPLAAGTYASAEGRVEAGAISTSLSLTHLGVPASAHANATWQRSFELNPHSSFTFSGIAAYGGLLGQTPVSSDSFYYSNFPNDIPLARMFTSTSNQGVASASGEVTVDALFFSTDPTTGQGNPLNTRDFDYRYNLGPDGRMALTITNEIDAPIYGRFNVELNHYASTVTAVPEPEMAFSLLVGLGLIGGVARRERTRTARRAVSAVA